MRSRFGDGRSTRRRAALLAVGLASIASPALAEANGWARIATGSPLGKGAAVCPIDDTITGDYLCFTLSCATRGTLQWGLVVTGAGDGSGSVTIDIATDGHPAGSVTLDPIASDYYAASYRPDADAPLTGALRAGRDASFRFSGALELELPVSLSGSSAALDHALSACSSG
jgi:hypothetical protein